MSRSGYSDDFSDEWAMIRWRGAVSSAIRGRRGQAFLRELLSALDMLLEKRLIENDFQAEGEVCALGAVATARGIDLSRLDPTDEEGVGDEVAFRLGIAGALAKEIMYENDEVWHRETPEHRYERVRKWVVSQIKVPR